MAHYYDIDDIVMEDESISVTFQVGANGVGLLDPSSESNHIEKGAKVDLPFWLAQELYLRQAATINFLPCFNLKTRKEVQADAACVNLKSHCPYFYKLGCRLAPLVADKSLGSFLRYTFTSRYKEILSKSHSAGANPKFATRMKEELQLFEAARCSMVDFKNWRIGKCRLEKASVLGRKRRTGAPERQTSP